MCWMLSLEHSGVKEVNLLIPTDVFLSLFKKKSVFIMKNKIYTKEREWASVCAHTSIHFAGYTLKNKLPCPHYLA